MDKSPLGSPLTGSTRTFGRFRSTLPVSFCARPSVTSTGLPAARKAVSLAARSGSLRAWTEKKAALASAGNWWQGTSGTPIIPTKSNTRGSFSGWLLGGL